MASDSRAHSRDADENLAEGPSDEMGLLVSSQRKQIEARGAIGLEVQVWFRTLQTSAAAGREERGSLLPCSSGGFQEEEERLGGAAGGCPESQSQT